MVRGEDGAMLTLEGTTKQTRCWARVPTGTPYSWRHSWGSACVSVKLGGGRYGPSTHLISFSATTCPGEPTRPKFKNHRWAQAELFLTSPSCSSLSLSSSHRSSSSSSLATASVSDPTSAAFSTLNKPSVQLCSFSQSDGVRSEPKWVRTNCL
jgi:hypothetical protein